jgi:ribA/ribD-fused uncharacterized protein
MVSAKLIKLTLCIYLPLVSKYNIYRSDPENENEMTTISDTTTTPDEIRSDSESDYIFFWDHVVSPSNPYSLAVYSQWYPLSFSDPAYPFPTSPSPSSTSSATSEPASASTNISTMSDPTRHASKDTPTFRTAEHYMMYAKALLFDPSRASDILQAPTPAEAQRLGRQLRNFKRERWDLYNDDIVQRANYLKFGQDSDGLALATLLDTGGVAGQDQDQDQVGDMVEDEDIDGKDNDRNIKAKAKGKGKELVEASPKDRIWGIGYGKEEAWEHRDEWGTNRSVPSPLIPSQRVPSHLPNLCARSICSSWRSCIPYSCIYHP